MLKIVKQTKGLDDNSDAAFSYNCIADLSLSEGKIDIFMLNKKRAIFFNSKFRNMSLYITELVTEALKR